jgi:Bromodomain
VPLSTEDEDVLRRLLARGVADVLHRESQRRLLAPERAARRAALLESEAARVYASHFPVDAPTAPDARAAFSLLSAELMAGAVISKLEDEDMDVLLDHGLLQSTIAEHEADIRREIAAERTAIAFAPSPTFERGPTDSHSAALPACPAALSVQSSTFDCSTAHPKTERGATPGVQAVAPLKSSPESTTRAEKNKNSKPSMDEFLSGIRKYSKSKPQKSNQSSCSLRPSLPPLSRKPISQRLSSSVFVAKETCQREVSTTAKDGNSLAMQQSRVVKDETILNVAPKNEQVECHQSTVPRTPRPLVGNTSPSLAVPSSSEGIQEEARGRISEVLVPETKPRSHERDSAHLKQFVGRGNCLENKGVGVVTSVRNQSILVAKRRLSTSANSATSTDTGDATEPSVAPAHRRVTSAAAIAPPKSRELTTEGELSGARQLRETAGAKSGKLQAEERPAQASKEPRAGKLQAEEKPGQASKEPRSGSKKGLREDENEEECMHAKDLANDVIVSAPQREGKPSPSASAARVADVDDAKLRRVRKAVEAVSRMPEAGPFLEPVNPSDPGCEHYYDEIHEPMDLGTILQRLRKRQYTNLDAVLREVGLVWSNCFLYNQDGDDISVMAEECRAMFDSLLKGSGVMGDGPSIGGVRKSGRRRKAKRHLDEVDCSDEDMRSIKEVKVRRVVLPEVKRKQVHDELKGAGDRKDSGVGEMRGVSAEQKCVYGKELVMKQVMVFCGLTRDKRGKLVMSGAAVRFQPGYVTKFHASDGTHDVFWSNENELAKRQKLSGLGVRIV